VDEPWLDFSQHKSTLTADGLGLRHDHAPQSPLPPIIKMKTTKRLVLFFGLAAAVSAAEPKAGTQADPAKPSEMMLTFFTPDEKSVSAALQLAAASQPKGRLVVSMVIPEFFVDFETILDSKKLKLDFKRPNRYIFIITDLESGKAVTELMFAANKDGSVNYRDFSETSGGDRPEDLRKIFAGLKSNEKTGKSTYSVALIRVPMRYLNREAVWLHSSDGKPESDFVVPILSEFMAWGLRYDPNTPYKYLDFEKMLYDDTKINLPYLSR
jgi:hypothetical protein